MYPFWQNYPPDNRGRQPKGDQFPWIEVGEHSIGSEVGQILNQKFEVADYGLPSGSDERFVISGSPISKATDGFTDSCWVFVDIKSVGPRDDKDHAVLSHNQLSGSGIWEDIFSGTKNDVLTAKGKYRSHDFYCSIPPIFILSNGMIAPVIMVVIKPVYSMLNLEGKGRTGQPLSRIDIVTIPNGLLLTEGPTYLKQYPQLLFPGKDDKGKNPKKLRARIDFKILRDIDDWRHQKIYSS